MEIATRDRPLTFLRAISSSSAGGRLPDHIIYVWLRSPELAIERVRDRVRRGGHHVPEVTVRRRYWRGLANFKQVYRPMADSWVLCDNSGERPLVVAQGERQAVATLIDPGVYDEFERSSPGE